MADAIIKIVESEEDVTEKEGVDLLASYFIAQGDVFIPKTNIADMFDSNTLMEVGRNVTNGYQADLDSMNE